MIVGDDRPNIPVGDRMLPDGGAPCAGVTAPVLPAPRPVRDWVFPAPGRHHRRVRPWYDLVSRATQSWSLTLRVAILLLVVLTGTAAIAAKIGLSAQAIVIALEAWYYARNRRVRGAE